MHRIQILRKNSPTHAPIVCQRCIWLHRVRVNRVGCNWCGVLLLVLAICVPLCAQRRPPQDASRWGYTRFGQFESNKKYTGISNNRIDTLVMATLRKQGIHPANLCSDEVFIRRVYLDVIGTLPEPQKVQRFLQDRSPRKRTALIQILLPRLIRLKATFPGGLTVHIQPGEDPLVVFADWLIAPDNPCFARNIVNRIRAWLLGRGIIHQLDDIQLYNLPSIHNSWPIRTSLQRVYAQTERRQTLKSKTPLFDGCPSSHPHRNRATIRPSPTT